MVEIKAFAYEVNGFDQQFIKVERTADIFGNLRRRFKLESYLLAGIQQVDVIDDACHLPGQGCEEFEIILIECIFLFNILDNQGANGLFLY